MTEKTATFARLSLADALTLSRPILAIGFVLFCQNRALALGLLVLAGATDIFDGPLARRHGGSPHGGWLDPLCDKLFMITAAVGIKMILGMTTVMLGLLLVRETLQTTSMLVRWAVPSIRRLPYDFSAHVLGKIATILQFFTLAALIYAHPAAPLLGIGAAATGVAAVAIYLARLARFKP